MLAVLVIGRRVRLGEALAGAFPYYDYVIVAACALLAWRFRRGRVLVAILALGLAGLAIETFPPGRTGAGGPAFPAVSFLLPLDLAAIALLGERGVLTRAGALRLAVLLGQAGLIVGLVLAGEAATGLFEYPFVPERYVAWLHVPQPALVVFGAAFVAVGVRLALRPDAIERGIFWALAATLLALRAAGSGGEPMLYLATAGLSLVLAVIESSYAMAYRDTLTGLPTRRALNEALERLEGGYTIAMVDVDHFKQCNDRYGHAVGDQVLRMVASRLDRVTGGGKAYRYGGEEFALLFPGKRVAEALPCMEEVRQAIEGTGFTLRGADRPRKKPKKAKRAKRGPAGRETIPVTVSMGAAEPTARTAEPDQVLKAADQALYRAKNAGRNRVAT